ncbi:MAG: hypothetical protein QOI77_1723 [Blastocatellia bacterium]|nr:hypothetical protein [Blastocatellia bacterium]
MEVNKLRAVRVVTRKPAVDKASRAASKVASRAASKVAKRDNKVVRRVVSKATANLFRRR